MKLSRRAFIVGSAAAGGGLAIGMRLPLGVDAAAAWSSIMRAAAPPLRT